MLTLIQIKRIRHCLCQDIDHVYAIFRAGPRANHVSVRTTWCPPTPCWWPQE